MSAAVMESSHVSRKTVSHGGPIYGQSSSAATSGNLENNLDALLEDLQTSVGPTGGSRSATPSRGIRAPVVDYQSSASSSKILSESKSQTVQPQSKTIAYKEVSYEIQKDLNGKPVEYVVESKPLQTTHTRNCSFQEFEEVDFVPAPKTTTTTLTSAPGNRKVTTTIETYMYELPGGTPVENFTMPKNVTTSSSSSSDKRHYESHSLTEGNYGLPKREETITYTVPTSNTDKAVHYETHTERYNIPKREETTITYTVPATTTDRNVHYETQLMSERYNLPQKETTISYAVPATTTDKNNFRYETHHLEAERYNLPPPTITTTTATDKNNFRYESHHLEAERYALPPREPPTTTTDKTVVYETQTLAESLPKYRTPTPTEIIKNSKMIHKEAKYYREDFVGGTPPFPRTQTPTTQTPPTKLDDLMATFSSESETIYRSDRDLEERPRPIKKEVEFAPHTPPQVKSKNVAGPPVYYPPGSGEFTRKEEYAAAASHAGGQWERAAAKYEYEASASSKHKEKTRKAVVPVCLPLCCALPCSIL